MCKTKRMCKMKRFVESVEKKEFDEEALEVLCKAEEEFARDISKEAEFYRVLEGGKHVTKKHYRMAALMLGFSIVSVK